MKSTSEEIRERFDNDVDRFSNLQTGQSATIDAPLVMDLITGAAAATNPEIKHVLDVGCGAGNYTLKLLERVPDFDVTLIDLSRPMLDRAVQRITPATMGTIRAIQGDVRDLALGDSEYDVILAAMVLHHLRDEREWTAVFEKFQRALRPGGWLWIADLVDHAVPQVQAMMWQRYGEYLTGMRDAAYRDQVFAYVEHEDTPRDVVFQIDLLRRVGFESADILHKNSCFAAFGARKRKVTA